MSDYIFFWSEKSKSEKIGKNCLSQWYDCYFVEPERHIEYHTAEQFMMMKKAELFDDYETLQKIREAKHPREYKALGRQIKNFDEDVWKKHRERIVYLGNLYKFSQNPELKGYLLSTGDAILVEASPYDRIWGIGLGLDVAEISSPQDWKGLNLLGEQLMRVRDKLKTGVDNPFRI